MIPGVEGDSDRFRELRERVREDLVLALCRAALLDMVMLPVTWVADRLLLGSEVEPDTMMLPLACVADRSVVETDTVLLLVEP